MIDTQYTNKEVRELLEEFRETHFNPNYNYLAKEIGVAYTYLIEFKNEKRVMGQESLGKIVDYIQENE